MCARRRGRRSGAEVTAELLTLLSALDERGSVIDADGIVRRLGCTRTHAQELLESLLALRDSEGVGLPLTVDGRDGRADSLNMAFGGGVRGYALTLTSLETQAVVAALRTMGVGETDLLTRLERASEPPQTSTQELLALLGEEVASSGTLSTCAEAIAETRELSFAYHKPHGTTTSRHVRPEGLRPQDGLWYLDAYDLDRAGMRVFRLDRMGETRVGRHIYSTVSKDAGATAPVTVTLHFAPDAPLRELDWPQLEVLAVEEDTGAVTATIPYFGGDWLVRHLAACGDTVTIDDRNLARRVRSYATAQLEAMGRSITDARARSTTA